MFVAIVHYPVYDKNRDIVATSVTNMEIHDIARSCMTFGIELCYIVTPLPRQREIMGKLMDHWERGFGSSYNPARKEALRKIRIINDMTELMSEIGETGEPILVGTSTRVRGDRVISYDGIRRMICDESRPALFLFGTGWGLTDETVDKCHRMLIPIRGAGDYNHLSLRVALGIILDRIFGERGGNNE